MIENLIESLHKEKRELLSKVNVLEYASSQARQIEILQELIIKNIEELITCKNNLENIINDCKMENTNTEIGELLLPEVKYLISLIEDREEDSLEIDYIIEEQENKIEAEKVIDASLTDAVHELENGMKKEFDKMAKESIKKELINRKRKHDKKRPVRKMK